MYNFDSITQSLRQIDKLKQFDSLVSIKQSSDWLLAEFDVLKQLDNSFKASIVQLPPQLIEVIDRLDRSAREVLQPSVLSLTSSLTQSLGLKQLNKALSQLSGETFEQINEFVQSFENFEIPDDADFSLSKDEETEIVQIAAEIISDPLNWQQKIEQHFKKWKANNPIFALVLCCLLLLNTLSSINSWVVSNFLNCISTKFSALKEQLDTTSSIITKKDEVETTKTEPEIAEAETTKIEPEMAEAETTKTEPEIAETETTKTEPEIAEAECETEKTEYTTDTQSEDTYSPGNYVPSPTNNRTISRITF